MTLTDNARPSATVLEHVFDSLFGQSKGGVAQRARIEQHGAAADGRVEAVLAAFATWCHLRRVRRRGDGGGRSLNQKVIDDIV